MSIEKEIRDMQNRFREVESEVIPSGQDIVINSAGNGQCAKCGYESSAHKIINNMRLCP